MLKEKTQFLFEIRQIPLFAEAVCGLAAFSQLERRLARLQEAVYRLDLFGESRWLISSAELTCVWEPIFSALAEEFGISREEANAICRPIVGYQEVELGLRTGRSALTIPIDRHYHLKKCDVEIQRTLVVRHAGIMPSKVVLARWQLFDVLSEIADDIDDIQEDTHTFNCNRLLTSCVENGASVTKKAYAVAVDALAKDFMMAGRIVDPLCRLFHSEVERIRQLLRCLDEAELRMPRAG